jgi:hypothetical protein
MIRLIAFAPFALALATSAHAMSPPPLHRADSMTTETQYIGYRYRGVARYGGVRRYGYGGYSRYGGYRHYYRGYRPGYGVARRQVRRCALWGAGHVCRRWVY